MICKNRDCWKCVWILFYTSGVTHAVACAHPDHKIRVNVLTLLLRKPV